MVVQFGGLVVGRLQDCCASGCSCRRGNNCEILAGNAEKYVPITSISWSKSTYEESLAFWVAVSVLLRIEEYLEAMDVQ